MRKWISEEIEFLRKNYPEQPISAIDLKLNRSINSIYKKAWRLGLKQKKTFWKDEIDFQLCDSCAIVDYRDIIETYKERQKREAYNYIKAKMLRKQGLTFREIVKSTNISYSVLQAWSKRRTPRAIKTIIKLTKLGLLPLLPDNTKQFKTFIKVFSFIFGDGNINSNLNQFTIVGEKSTLERLKSELKFVLPTLSCKIKNLKTEGKFQNRIIKGESWIFLVNDSSLARLLHTAGAPKGNKVIQSFRVPPWVFKLSKNLKSIFLGAFWSSDGTKPIWSQRGFHLCFQLNKNIELKDDHEFFLNGLKKLLAEFDIKTSPVKWVGKPYERKDRRLIDKAYFFVSTKPENFFRFYKSVPNFSEERKKEFRKALNFAKELLIKRQKRIDTFIKVKDMFEEGKSMVKISRELRLPYSTVKAWVRGITIPRGYSNDKQIQG